MRLTNRRPWLTFPLILLFLPGCDKNPTPTEAAVEPSPAAALASSGTQVPFSDAEVFFEFNTTDNDLGFQVFLDAQGWRSVDLAGPKDSPVFHLLADGRLAEIGITELRFESAEPSPAEVLSRFPAGVYEFEGLAVDGTRLMSTSRLSHQLLDAPTFSPRDGQVVDQNNTVVQWNAPGAEQVEVIIENVDLGEVFDVTVLGSTTQLTLPPQFLRPGTEYTIELLSIARNRNRTIAQSTFRTGA